MKKIINLLLFLLGNLIKFRYDKKYINGKYFEHHESKVLAVGWKLITKDYLLNMLNGTNKKVPFPVSHKVTVVNGSNIIFHPDDLHIFHTYGTYFQAMKGKIYIGKGSYVGPNVGIITTNHDLNDLSKHTSGKDVVIGDSCWIGMNSVILPGTVLGKNTIVGAGSIVTKSFPEGNQVIAGNPARVIKQISNDK